MKRSRIIIVLNVLIIVSILAGVAVLGAIALTGLNSASAFSVGSASATSSGSVTNINLPLTLTNKGYLSLSIASIAVTLRDSAGDQLVTGSIGPVTIPPGQTSHINASLQLDTSKLPASVLQSLATTSQNLTASATIGASLPPFLGVSGAVSAQVPWGAPLSGLSIGTPVVSAFNSTHFKASVPISFADHSSMIPVKTNLVATLTNSTSGAKVGAGTLAVDVAPGGSFSSSLTAYVKIPAAGLSNLLFNDATLHYSAQVLGSSSGLTFSFNRAFDVAWGAPLKSLAFGKLTTAVFNSTYARVSAPMSFTDGSAFLSLTGSVQGTVTDASGNLLGTISQMTISSAPGSQTSASLSGFIKNSAVGQSSYVLHLTFATPLGTVTKVVTVSA